MVLLCWAKRGNVGNGCAAVAEVAVGCEDGVGLADSRFVTGGDCGVTSVIAGPRTPIVRCVPQDIVAVRAGVRQLVIVAVAELAAAGTNTTDSPRAKAAAPALEFPSVAARMDITFPTAEAAAGNYW